MCRLTPPETKKSGDLAISKPQTYRTKTMPDLPGIAYLGDSVYIEYDGFNFVLTTKNGSGPSNIIVMEPQTIDGFNQYCQEVAGAIRNAT